MPDFSGIDLTGGLGLGLGAGAVALVGRFGRTASSALQTYFRRNYTTKLEVPNNDMAYEWLLAHLAKRQDFASHFSIGTRADFSAGGSLRKTDFNLKPAPGTHLLWEPRPGKKIPWPIRVERTRSQPTASNEPFETIVLESLCLSKIEGKNRMLEILERARKEAVSQIEESITTEVYGTNGQKWEKLSSQARRPIDSVVLDPGETERILQDMVTFSKNRAWYTDKGIPHRRGYLFYGTPGSGKTALITALAGEMKYSVSLLNLSNYMMDDAQFMHVLNKAPPESIVVLEDIDCAFRDRSKDLEGDPRYSGMSGGVTHSGLLNAIDGVTNSDGRILIMTTNYIERLDSALIRPGRVDVAREFTDATDAQICGMYLKFFPSAPDTYAWNFLTSVRSHCEDGVSMARLQGHLTSFRDPIKAIENGHLLSKTSTDFSGQTQTESPDLKLEHFIGGKL